MSIYSGMTVGDRILYVRENCGKLSQEEFSNRLGMTKSAISGYETGRRTPTDSVLKHISREFGVDEDWLRDGSGDPFEETDGDVLQEVFKRFTCSDFEKAFLTAYLYMDVGARLAFSSHLEKMFRDTAEALGYKKDDSSAPATPGLDIDAEVASYRRELELQEKVAAELSVSDGRSAIG